MDPEKVKQNKQIIESIKKIGAIATFEKFMCKEIVDSIKKEGALATVEKGLISLDEFECAQLFENGLKEIEEKEKQLKLDVPKGTYIKFDCSKNGKEYLICSEKRPEKKDKEECTPKLMRDENGVGYVEIGGYEDDDDEHFVKRKHYYFYSKDPGYGKTPFCKALLDRTNAAHILGFSNELNVLEYAQFLVIDDFGPDRKIDMANLKCLTSGLAFACSGDVQPRKDAQLIIFSNNHLFDVMGDPEDETRKIPEREAKILLDRFFIYRLDETENETEETDRFKHTAS
ncbi:hypothetical protein EGW08_017512 [Elysia chlorotica]|uniref:Uncharacterized protein n=1 Tax=Elysia chlorotica TaxID=188477 RepID=A0A433SZK9_ELYCH|nr:hypothetical protein EGW08_017512 [Elysia chlorotica]